MMTDPISDFLIQIKNGYLARKVNLVIPYSKMKGELAKLLVKEGYLGKVEIQKQGKVKKGIQVSLVYKGKDPRLTDVVRVSKIARRVYVSKERIPQVLGGLGVTIVSTPFGLMTEKEARKKGSGGEIICKIW